MTTDKITDNSGILTSHENVVAGSSHKQKQAACLHGVSHFKTASSASSTSSVDMDFI